ncbi:hypothetical protein [Arthrobacter sp. H14]|uniref:hypothetical protein n=1 Tax=Arthrobacter sp. H14 TaxID=1312959 RepID=UPI0020A6396B|nr:hypothetical protein [Arthrobacter sp. H14]
MSGTEHNGLADTPGAREYSEKSRGACAETEAIVELIEKSGAANNVRRRSTSRGTERVFRTT